MRPTYLPTVPRILNRVHGKILEGVNNSNAFSRYLFNKAIADKTYYLQNQGAFTHRVYDKILSKVRNLFGGRVRAMITASAPISGDVLTFFKVALGIHIYEVYG